MRRSKPLLFLLSILPYAIILFFVADIFTSRITDNFLVGTAHGHVGFDFYSVPRSFINLQHGQNLYNLEYAGWYGPHATPYYYHPAISILVGSWLSLLPAKTAFAVFVMVIAALLLISGHVWAAYFTDPFKKKLAVLLTACSLPAYLVMWNAQMHIFTVVSVVLLLTAILDMLNGKSAQKKLVAGLLVSLFSKPLILLWVPGLLAVKETRAATIKSLIIYAMVSAAFFVVPFLQPQGSNITHWENIVNQSTSVGQDKEYFSFATTFPLPLPGKLKNSLYLLVPLLLCISSLRLARIADSKKRLRVLLLLLLALLASYYFAYSLVWEYHYTTLLAAVPCMLYLYSVSKAGEKRHWKYVFITALSLYLPTTYIFRHDLAPGLALIMHLCKVLPVTVLLVMLIVQYRRNREQALSCLE